MGGHGHHSEPYTVPKADIYKVENAPKLVQTRDALARVGLKDPWLRNEVWRYNPKYFKTHSQRLTIFLFRGLPLGVALFAGTIAIEQALGIDWHHPRGHHGAHAEDHGNGHH